MNILLAGRWDVAERDVWAAALAAALPGHRLLLDRHAVAPEAIEAAIVANPPQGSLQGLPALRLIQSLWAGVDQLLADATLPAGVPIARMVDPTMSAAMAQTALWATLGLHRGYFAYAQQQRRAWWQALPQRRADEVPVLLLGLGQMGLAAALQLRAAGYPVTAWRREATPWRDGDADVAPDTLAMHGDGNTSARPSLRVIHGADALRAALPQAQVLINLLPLTPATRGLLEAGLLQRLPPGAGLVNLGRGAHLVEADLLAALDRGHLGHAVLDVFSQEPLPADHPFWQHPRVTVLPHVAALTDVRSAAAVAAANITALAARQPIRHRVWPEAGY